MKVRELIEELQAFDDEAEVHFTYNYGDYWRTSVAPKARHVEMMPIVHSEYHSMPKLIDDDDERYNDAQQVVVISS